MLFKKGLAIAVAALMLLGLAACAGTPAATSAPAQSGAPAQQESAAPAETTTTPVAPAAEPTAASNVKDPFGKYDPEITLTSLYGKDSTEEKGFGDNNTIEDNVWTRLAKEQLGINISYKWIVASDQYESKLNVSIASNDLPDVIPGKTKQMTMLLDADALADLLPAINDYASPLLKEIMDKNKTTTLNAAAIGGKIYGIPSGTNAANILNAEVLFIRKDWLTKLNLPEPKTMQDVLNISKAFTTQDPDGNGKPDTIGLAINKTLSGIGFTDVAGFFNGYHSYPYYWIKDTSGQLAYGGVQPEAKAALQQLQQMFKDGELDKEFGVKDSGTAAELLTSGKCGMEFGLAWDPMYPLNLSNQNDANADWEAYPLVSIDDKPAQPMLPVGGSGTYWMVSKSYEHPEAFIKLLNQYAEKGFGATADRGTYYDDPEGHNIFKLQLSNFQFVRFDEERTWYDSVHEVFATGDKSKFVDSKAEQIYNNIVDYKNGNTKGKWEWFKFYDYDTGAVRVNLKDYLDGGLLLYDSFYGAPTATMSEKWATLQKMQDEVFTNIINGGADIGSFDKFVSDWKSLGGDQITKEVNDWYATVK